MNRKICMMILTAVCTAQALGLTAMAGPVSPETGLMEDVTPEMTEPEYWTEGRRDTDKVLAEAADIQAINAAIYAEPACMISDMSTARDTFIRNELYRNLWTSTFQDAAGMIGTQHYDAEGNALDGRAILDIIQNVEGEAAEDAEETAGTAAQADPAAQETVRYGICVKWTDVKAFPSEVVATDEKGDSDYNYMQLSALRVNEPVTVKVESKDGAYYYCEADCISGWVRAEDIAICSTKEEWLNAWQFPDSEALVVTEGKVYLEESNVNPDAGGTMLTMGTVLRKVPDAEYNETVTGRIPVHNYAAWLPVRREDGSYDKTIALISKRYQVSEGYLPVTTNNILQVAFTRLGDVYGWGSMLNSVDCSNYIRDIYKCFGLSLARNTTWQAAMPVHKYDVSAADNDQKKSLLNLLPPGAILILNGHEMLYLGRSGDKYFVISAAGGVKDTTTGEYAKIRGVIINDLDQMRMNDKTWLESLETMLIPYLPLQEEGPEVLIAPEPEEETPSDPAV